MKSRSFGTPRHKATEIFVLPSSVRRAFVLQRGCLVCIFVDAVDAVDEVDLVGLVDLVDLVDGPARRCCRQRR
ncbi:MAG: hypothetical protein RBT84_18125, partial [FCB group bacterium]|nr:hypothetical protein [FCB group bacterium]